MPLKKYKKKTAQLNASSHRRKKKASQMLLIKKEMITHFKCLLSNKVEDNPFLMPPIKQKRGQHISKASYQNKIEDNTF